MSVIPPFVKTGLVQGVQIVVGVDTPNDVDVEPDAAFPIGSTLTFVPSVPYLLFPDQTPKTTLYPQEVLASIGQDGNPVTPTGDPLRLIATDQGNPSGWFWTVTPRINGTKLKAFALYVPSDGTAYLTDAQPIPASPGNATVRGPQGLAGTPGRDGINLPPAGTPAGRMPRVTAAGGLDYASDPDQLYTPLPKLPGTKTLFPYLTAGAAAWLDSVAMRGALGVDVGTVNAADPAYGVWPSAGHGDITANLVAAVTAAASGFNRSRRVLIPAGTYTADLTAVMNAWGTTNTIQVWGMGRNSTYITDTSATGGLLVNSAVNVLFLDIRDMTIDGCWGLVRLAYTGASSQAGCYRNISNVECRNVKGTMISSASNDQAFWFVDARGQAASGTDPGLTGGTMLCAINGMMDRSEIRINGGRFRVGSKFGHVGQNSRIHFGDTQDPTAGRTWWNAACWLVPEQNGPGSTDGRGPGHPGATFYSSKCGSEGLNAAIDYRFISVDEAGTLYAQSGIGGLQIGFQASLEIPRGYTVDVVDAGGTGFSLVCKKNGVVVETSPVFASMQAAAAWGAHPSDGGTAKFLFVLDLSNAKNTTSWPAPQTNVTIGDWSTNLPMVDGSGAFVRSQGWIQGVHIVNTKVTGAGQIPNPPLWTVAVPPSQLVSCLIADTTVLDSTGATNDPNWPAYMVKFVGDTTAPSSRYLNVLRSTLPNTARKPATAQTSPVITACNVPGVFLIGSDEWVHLGVPTAALDPAGNAGTTVNGATSPTVTGNDRRHTVAWKTATTGTSPGAQVNVTFNRPFASPPAVTLTMGGNHAVPYVLNVTAAGYTIGASSAGTLPNKNMVALVTVEPVP